MRRSNITFRLPNSLSTYFGGLILELGLLQLPFFITSTFFDEFRQETTSTEPLAMLETS
ncbi:MAG TPA: hypothetical protein VNA15_09970 [Candidatus Angelobacter sp.]|nr:hypothetical protein [Candidatus Angelobacter sp.]